MATRAHMKIDKAVIHSFTAGAGGITKGKRVKFGADDLTVLDCGAGEDGIGFAREAKAAGEPVSVVLEGCAVIPVLVGTGGATRGGYAITVANGVADQAIADGTTPRRLAGKFMQSGVVGDIVGLLVGVSTPMSTA